MGRNRQRLQQSAIRRQRRGRRDASANSVHLYRDRRGLVLPAAPFAQFDRLIERVPNEANTIMLADAAALRRTLADKPDYASGLRLLPRDVERAVSAAKLDFATFEPMQTLVSVELTREAQLPEFAAARGGSIDNIEGKQVAVLPGDAFVIRMGPKEVVAGVPAVRQDVVRFLRQPGLAGNIPNYLAEAQKFAEQGSQIIMAMDLSGVVSFAEVETKVKMAKDNYPEGTDIDALTRVLVTLRGISLGVRITSDGVFGGVKVDFEEDVAPLKGLAKDMLLRVLGDHGATIHELQDWQVQMEQKAVLLTGKLQPSGLLRVISLLEAPPEIRPPEESVGSPGESDESLKERQVITATQNYIGTMKSLVDDLSKKKPGSVGQVGVWYKRYAKKIDELQMKNVDPEVLELGMYVSNTLRQGAMGITQASAQASMNVGRVSGQYDYQTYSEPIGVVGSRWGRPARVYSWNGWRAVPNARRESQLRTQARREGRVNSFYAANLALQRVEQAMQKIRYEMTVKYGENF